MEQTGNGHFNITTALRSGLTFQSMLKLKDILLNVGNRMSHLELLEAQLKSP